MVGRELTGRQAGDRLRTSNAESSPFPCQASQVHRNSCLLYTSDAADDLLCVDLGGRRIIKKKTKIQANELLTTIKSTKQPPETQQ